MPSLRDRAISTNGWDSSFQLALHFGDEGTNAISDSTVNDRKPYLLRDQYSRSNVLGGCYQFPHLGSGTNYFLENGSLVARGSKVMATHFTDHARIGGWGNNYRHYTYHGMFDEFR